MLVQNEQKNLGNTAAIAALTLGLIILWPGLLKNLLVARGFIPHGHCYLWKPGLVALHLSSDVSIALAYSAISATLAYLVYTTRKEIPFHWMFLAFGTFILACGSTHLMEAWTLWHPVYWLSGMLKLMTAVASITTAVVLPTLVPRALALLESAKLSEERRLNLENANRELAALYDKLKELDEIKTQFFANVSHELRTPLTLILGPTQNLLAEKGLSQQQRRELAVIEGNARLLLKHVNDLLDIAKLEAGKMSLNRTDADLAQLVRLSAANFEAVARDRQINFSIETPESLPGSVDAAKIQRIILNLLSNAFKFTPQGGRIRCSLSAATDASGGNRAAIAVADSGSGVPVELREAIFERFRQVEGGATRRFGGTGLGLAIVKEFAELHGGSVSVSDAPEGGALFTVELSVAATAIASEPATLVESLPAEDIGLSLVEELSACDRPDPATEAQDADKALVLIVEDNPDMNRFLVESLGGEYRTAIAFNGEEGLQLALELQPDLILSDVMMPRLSGDRLARLLRNYPEMETTPIVMLTAKADDELRVQLLREGVQDYLMKPFSVEELRARVGNLIAIKRSRETLQRELASQNQDLQVLAKEVAASRRELQAALTAQQQQAEELARANRIKDEFLAVVSHELRTPLNSILGWAQLMRSGKLNAATVNKALETIERNAKQQVGLIDDILDVSRIVRGKIRLSMRPVNPVDVVQEAIETVWPTAQAKNIEIVKIFRETRLPEAPAGGQVWGDRDRLQQVAWNLLANAVKFTPPGGRVEIAIECQDACVQLRVRDNGTGIAPAFLPYVFEGFRQENSSTTRAYGGLGLGLTICRYLVELHGGTIFAFSEGEGKGATFSVSLPLARSLKAENQLELGGSDPPTFSNNLWSLDGLRVVVADDDADTCDLIAAALSQYGVQVTAVNSAAEAIAAIERVKPDILVSDIGMPGESGYQLIGKLRQLEAEKGAKIPAIALTAFARQADRDRALKAGFQMHLPKPVEPVFLAAAVAQLAEQA